MRGCRCGARSYDQRSSMQIDRVWRPRPAGVNTFAAALGAQFAERDGR